MLEVTGHAGGQLHRSRVVLQQPCMHVVQLLECPLGLPPERRHSHQASEFEDLGRGDRLGEGGKILGDHAAALPGRRRG